MGKLSRVVQLVFGSSAGSTQIAQFGSLAAGSIQYTSNPYTIQQLPEFIDGWYAAVVAGNSPAIEDMNAIHFLYAYQLAYLFQAGIPEYDGSTVYYHNSLCQSGGSLYQAVYASVDGFSGTTPPNVSYWQTLISNQITTLGDLVYGGANGVPTRLMGNNTTTRNFLRQTGTGGSSAAPVWDTLASGDVPAVNLSVYGSAGGVTGSLPFAYINLNSAGQGLLPNEAVVTDGSQHLTSMGYSAVGGSSNFVTRDVNGSSVIHSLNTFFTVVSGTLTATGNITTAIPALRAVVTDVTNNLTASTTTSTELDYVHGVTSGIQGQIDTKAPKINPLFAAPIGLTAIAGSVTVTVPNTVTSYTVTLPNAQGGSNTTLINDGAGGLTWGAGGGSGGSGTVTYVGMTVPSSLSVSPASITGSGTFALSYGSPLPQANGGTGDTGTLLASLAPKANPSFTGSIHTPLGSSFVMVTDGSGNLAVSGTTTTEVGYVSGVTSAIQTQLGTKAPLAGPLFTGSVNILGSTSGTLSVTVPAAVTSHTLTLPAAQGSVSTVLQNNGSGTLSWATVGISGVAGSWASTTGNVVTTNGDSAAQDSGTALSALPTLAAFNTFTGTANVLQGAIVAGSWNRPVTYANQGYNTNPAKNNAILNGWGILGNDTNSVNGYTCYLTANSYFDSGNAKAFVGSPNVGARLTLVASGTGAPKFTFDTAAAVALGSTQTFSTGLTISPTVGGTVSSITGLNRLYFGSGSAAGAVAGAQAAGSPCAFITGTGQLRVVLDDDQHFAGSRNPAWVFDTDYSFHGWDQASGLGSTTAATTAHAVILRGGDNSYTGSTATGAGGAVTVIAGSATGAASLGDGGNLTVAGGTTVGGNAGSVFIQTAGTTRITVDKSGNTTFGVNINTPIVNITAAQTTLTGAAGTAVCSQAHQGSSYKKAVVFLNGYTDTGTLSYTFPVAFTQTPYVYGLAAGVTGATATTTTVKFTVTTQTGFVFIEGY